MNRILIPSLMIFVFIVFLLPITSPGQQRGRKTVPNRPSRPSAGYTLEPFDLAAEKLPPGFKGHDMEAVYKILDTRGDHEKKGEFETTAAFNKRIESERSRPIVGNLTVNDIFAFDMELTNDSPYASIIYNPDEEKLRFEIATASDVPYDLFKKGEAHVRLRTKMRFLPNSSYVASNRFGASTRVEKLRSTRYEIEFLYDQAFSGGNMNKHLIATFSADIKLPQARAAKANAKGIAVCKLREPFVGADSEGHTPKIDEPWDDETTIKIIKADLLEFWLYDIATGTIYAKIKKGSRVVN